jgi:hypothetical protein
MIARMLRFYTAFCCTFIACTVTPQARFAKELGECVDNAPSRAEADTCRDGVEAKYSDAGGYEPRDAGREGGDR